MDKVKITPEQLHDFNNFKDFFAEDAKKEFLAVEYSINKKKYQGLEDISFDQIVAILYDNYELITPEDELREYYRILKGYIDAKDGVNIESEKGQLEGVKETLRLLNIRIEGVNI